jgi:NADH:ubiquinone oxidoreductase subunit 6 (subunit J)
MEKLYEYLTLIMIIFGFITIITSIFLSFAISAKANEIFYSGLILFFLFFIGSMIIWTTGKRIIK